ncbi:MAG TPA: hypothetical protein PLP69_00370, partial [Bacteroidales bacterium]|nr:hypothetical protein [Bacteroidales bacterium]
LTGIFTIFVMIHPFNKRKRITMAEIKITIRLFESNLGVISSLKKLVKSINGSDTLNITFDNMALESFVKTPTLAAITPTITAMASINICERIIPVSDMLLRC